MNDRFTVAFTPRAAREVAEAKRWWRANRSKAPDALDEELRTTLDLIAATPGIGAVARNVMLPGVRRIFLNRVKTPLLFPCSSPSCRRRHNSKSLRRGRAASPGRRDSFLSRRIGCVTRRFHLNEDGELQIDPPAVPQRQLRITIAESSAHEKCPCSRKSCVAPRLSLTALVGKQILRILVEAPKS